jgi:N-acetylglutamate synthase-like GNAT family acetyltransferase
MIRPAKRSDVPEIIGLIANDPLGAKRENFQDPLPDTYYEAFEIIERDPHQELMVFEGANQKVVGVFQLSFIQYLTYQGGKRAQIEGVRVHEDMRGHGLGEQMFKWVIDRA